MKIFCLGMILGLAALLTGCGASHSMVKDNSSSPAPGPQMQAFFGLGDVVQTVNGVQVTVSADKLFKKNSHHFSKAGLQMVDAIAAAILKYPGGSVAVNGYTDNVGTDMKNVKFSQRRADEVKKELVL
jgi:outer membrane protein OmpA-like peptidoglycan-associated protein